MNKYESVIIISSNLEEVVVNDLIKKFETIINKFGKVESIENIGRKKLAYEIKKQKEGIYVIYTFDDEADLIVELERNYRITDNVIKFMTIRK